MTDQKATEGQIVSERDAVASGKTVVQLWLDKIAAARAEEEDWRESAAKATEVYEAGKDQKSAFNIYHANVETIIPALYNSTPIPDVRRRYDPEPVNQAEFAGLDEQSAQMAFQQAQQQVAQLGALHHSVAEMTERALTFSVDQYDFDDVVEDCVRDAEVTGRGVPRIRLFKAEAGGVDSVTAELVQWNRFIRGPGINWQAVPFVAFRHDLTREQVARLLPPEEADARLRELTFASQDDEEKQASDDKRKHKGILKTIPVYETWDKANRKVLFITPNDKLRPLTEQADPLGLTGFFPVPKPLQMVRRLTSQIPVCPYDIYATLIDEIDVVSRRITALIKQLVIKGGYDPAMAPDFKQLEDAEDGKFVPVSASEQFVQGANGDLNRAIWFWPIEPIMKVIGALYEQREAIKQTIYEVMGVSDILRGQVDPREKLGQSQIKEASGSRRIQRSQAEVARLARDLFRMKAEIMHKHFSPESLGLMTGMRITPQMTEHMQSEARAYSIDIETDSTVRADMGRFQEELNAFLQGTAQITQSATAMAPVMPKAVPAMFDVFASFARKFNLGKQGEDALEKLSEAATEPINDPEAGAAEAAKVEAEARQREAEAAGQREAERHEREMQLKDKDIEIKVLDLETRREVAGIDTEAKLLDLDIKREMLGHQQETQRMDAEAGERKLAHADRMADVKERQAAKKRPQA